MRSLLSLLLSISLLTINLTFSMPGGYVGQLDEVMDRPEFHHHAERGIVYQHPLIRYDVSGNQAMILGLAEGAFLLRSLPALENVAFGW